MRLLLLLTLTTPVNAATIDFEDQTDGTSLTNQYPGITFTNATILTAGISLNEFDFPPHSGTNVIFDDAGPVSVSFAQPIVRFAIFITYVVPVVITAYDDADQELAVVTSLFANNTGLGGELGSSSNEQVVIEASSGARRFTVAGLPAGSSYVIDDIEATEVPEPQAPGLLALAWSAIAMFKKKR